MHVGDLVSCSKQRFNERRNCTKLGVIIEQLQMKPIENTSCFDGPTGESRTRVAWCDGTGLEWVNTNDLTKEKK